MKNLEVDIGEHYLMSDELWI